MAQVIYICWVSGTGKTSIVKHLQADKTYTTIFFSGEMKRIGLEYGYISSPEDVYHLDNGKRQLLEDSVREYIDRLKKSWPNKIIIDGHLMVEWADWTPRPTLSLEQGALVDELVIIQWDSIHISENRKNHWFRPTSNDKKEIEKMQVATLERADELIHRNHTRKHIIYNSHNNLSNLIADVEKIIQSI